MEISVRPHLNLFLGEFILGVSTYAKHTKQIPSEDKVLEIFTKYVQEIASPGRPFYYHNSKTNLDALFETIPVEPKPSIVPFEEPKEASFWYKQWILPEFQGCTLVSDMLKNATNFGIPHKSIVENSLIAFLKTWWRLPMEDKAKINFEVSLGDYEEKAISIIINEGPSCHDHSPMAYTNTRASSVFVYHPMVINDFRRQKLLPFFKRYDNAIDSTKIQIEVRDHAEEIYERFMSAVSPNANVNTFTLRIITSGEVEKSKISSLRVTTMISMILLVLLFLIAVMVGSGIGSFYLGRKYQRNIVETQGTKMKEDEKDQQPPVVLEEQKNDESFK